jgi:mRNA interferase RelE/StbE
VTYELRFHPKALRAWGQLDKKVRERLKAKLAERLEAPAVASARLAGDLNHLFKIKLNSTGHRLVYEILEPERAIYVLAVGVREDLKVYQAARKNMG